MLVEQAKIKEANLKTKFAKDKHVKAKKRLDELKNIRGLPKSKVKKNK